MSMYENFAATLDTARNREAGKPIANNTRLFDRGEGVLAIRLHNTDIVTMHPDGRVTLDSDGWQTATTKERMNRYLPNGVSVWQKNKRWYVTLSYDRTPAPDYFNTERGGDRSTAFQTWLDEDSAKRAARTVPYFDGITLDAEGNALNGPTPEEWAAFDRLLAKRTKALSRYIGKVSRGLKDGLPMPSGADCWMCAMGMDPDAAPALDHAPNRDRDECDHFVSHMEEGYVVPSLLVNALREAGYQDTGIYFWLGMKPEDNVMRTSDPSTVLRAVRKYMERRILPAPPTV